MEKQVANLIIIIIRGYQALISPFFGPCCRFYPSCSNYALECVNRHGAFTGLYLILKRALKCHPWGGEGVDLVPEKPFLWASKAIDKSKRKNGLEKT
ncbi:MAG: membrane protein insertion efficiency factor YidD [Cellvibrionales bacterium TMED49]|nr:MAG: membrane protein insertion efficiency factor YidD [Cellvibrionales bacterium TMED49]